MSLADEEALLRLIELFMRLEDDGVDIGTVGTDIYEDMLSEIDVKVIRA